MSTIQMMGASTKGRGMAAANCNRDKFASFFAVADKNKKKKEPTQKNGAKSVVQWGCHGEVQWGVGCFLTAAFEATR